MVAKAHVASTNTATSGRDGNPRPRGRLVRRYTDTQLPITRLAATLQQRSRDHR